MLKDHIQIGDPIWILRKGKFSKAVLRSIGKTTCGCAIETGETIQVPFADVARRSLIPTYYDPTRGDLMELDVLNEPQIIENLTVRLLSRQIYTYIDETLIVLNPYEMFTEKYTLQVKEDYLRRKQGLEPHIYGIVSKMITQLLTQSKNQAVIISGESGAGKTETNKECIRFLNYCFKSEGVNTIESVLALSSPLLESFGNAKTIRNNNSSRFGKFLRVTVSHKREITNAQIYNYLLEKSRLISRAENEQNFHILYQLLNGLTQNQKRLYNLLDESGQPMTPEKFAYLKDETGKCVYRPHPDAAFEKVVESLRFFPPETFDLVCRILSAILFLGNLSPIFEQKQQQYRILPDKSLGVIGELLGVDAVGLEKSLLSFKMKVGGEVLTKLFNQREVQQLIHSLSKALYERLFQWLIETLNSLCRGESKEKLAGSIGFLDIYGFQVLQHNSLEQLFINYTNERLHQIYLQCIFKAEKATFIAQGLQNRYVQTQFSDNMTIIELIEHNQLSIFNCLDEWCSITSPNESSFVEKIRHNHKKNPSFPPENDNLVTSLFMIRHTPEDVTYQAGLFKEKNKDLLRDQIKEVLRASKVPLISQIMNQPVETESEANKSIKYKRFLSMKFRKEMDSLCTRLLSDCNLSFVRCVKPNEVKQPIFVDQKVLFNQTHYLGLLDTIKIKKLGFCYKLSYDSIDRNYSWLVRRNFTQSASPSEIAKILTIFIGKQTETEMLLGKTKIFLTDGAFAVFNRKYRAFEKSLRIKVAKMTTLLIANSFKRKFQRKKANCMKVKQYLSTIPYVNVIQAYTKKISLVQLAIRHFLERARAKRKLESCLIIQSYIRRVVETYAKTKQLERVKKIIGLLRRNVIRRKAQKKLVAYFIITQLLSRSWSQVKQKYRAKISKYFQGLLVHLRQSTQMAVVQQRYFNQLKERNFNKIEQYFHASLQNAKLKRHLNRIAKLQATIRAYRIGNQYQLLRRAAIVIQKSWRIYWLRKKGQEHLFKQTFPNFDDEMQLINNRLRSVIHEGVFEQEIRRYLEKFKKKMSLVYVPIDIEALAPCNSIYSEDKWTRNLIDVARQSFRKDDPLQQIHVNQSCTVAASTHRIYVWGSHERYDCMDGPVNVKTKDVPQWIQMTSQDFILKQGPPQRHKKSTVNREFDVNAGKISMRIYEVFRNLRLQERVTEVACGYLHTVILTTSNHVYTLGNGTDGQLGHGSFHSLQEPKKVDFKIKLKTVFPVQVAAGFKSTLVLLSNNKLIWWGQNSVLKRIENPIPFDLKGHAPPLDASKSGSPSIVRVMGSWSQTMSVSGVTLLYYNGVWGSNAALRTKMTSLLVQKWHERGIHFINPPYVAVVSDHLEECHVLLPGKKTSIEPESRRIHKEIQARIKSGQQEKILDFSFSQEFRAQKEL